MLCTILREEETNLPKLTIEGTGTFDVKKAQN